MSPLLRLATAAPALLLVLGCAHNPTPSTERDPRTVVFRPEEVDEPPELIKCGDWMEHGQARITFAVIQFIVTATGEVRDPRVIQAPPRIPEVGLDAMRVARTCQYRPAMREGKPVAVRWSKRFDFVGQ